MVGDSHDKTSTELIESTRAWEAYLAEIWCNFLISLGLEEKGTVVEVGPGMSDKIGRALAKIGFNGMLYLVDPSEQTLLILGQHYSDLLPHATIQPIVATLVQAGSLIKTQPTCIISSHCVDDMILAAGRQELPLNSLFDWSSYEDYQRTIPVSLKLWAELENDLNRLRMAKEAVQDEWCKVIKILEPAFCVLSQYPTAKPEYAQMGRLNDHALDILGQIAAQFPDRVMDLDDSQAQLGRNRIYEGEAFGREVLEAKNWLVIEG